MRKIISLLLVAAVIFSMSACGSKKLVYNANLYFVNSDSTELVQEKREITISEGKSIAECVVQELMTGPKNPEYKSIIPKTAELNSVIHTSDLAIIDFSGEMDFKTDADLILFSTSVLRTVTEIEGVSRVLITENGGDLKNLEGDIIGIMNKSDTVYDTTPEVAQYQYMTLYFADLNGSKLSKETRKVVVNEKESLEIQALKELIKGPSDKELGKTIPVETKILSVETKEGVCFVNLSQEFISRHTGGTASEQLTIYSIVNTLTELSGVDKVQFLIEGQKSESFIHMLINEPFVRDESIIK